jgi:hypothetical protein
MSTCECAPERHDGSSLWPCGSDCDFSRPYVERFDSCERFDNDEDAAAHVARTVGGIVVMTLRHDQLGRWQPAVYPWPEGER